MIFLVFIDIKPRYNYERFMMFKIYKTDKIILMNFFPGIYEPKRTKKATSFSNPIAGTFYNNKDFLKNCRNVPRSIS